MTRIKVKKLTWADWNIKHIKEKHNLTVEEAEIAAKNLVAHKKGYKGRYIVIGRSGRRIVAVIVVREKVGQYFAVTARDANKDERERIYEKEKNRQNP